MLHRARAPRGSSSGTRRPAPSRASTSGCAGRRQASFPGHATGGSSAGCGTTRLDVLPAAAPLNYALLELDGRASAYALYRLVQREESGTWTRRLHVIEALGADVEGTREIWRFLFGIDWVDEILAWYLPADHPLMHLVARLDRLDLGVETGLWVRLVDVGSALSARGYATDGRVTFEVTDTFGPWNAGTWTLDGGVARRSRRRPDLRLDVTSLGATYLGGFSVRAARAGGSRRGSAAWGAARADAMFATDRAPWCPGELLRPGYQPAARVTSSADCSMLRTSVLMTRS